MRSGEHEQNDRRRGLSRYGGQNRRNLPRCRRGFSISTVERTRIKICGVTRPEDAAAAARAGADAVGINCYEPAPRYVPAQRIAEILNELPPFVSPVLVFVDASAQKVREVATSLGVRHVQLHGRETPEQVAELRSFSVIKAVRVDAATFGQELETWRAAARKLKLTHLRGILLETAHASEPGGTGTPNDWETVRRHRQRGDFVGLPPVIAAGGLTPDSVAAVVRDLRPYAVDVSSGV